MQPYLVRRNEKGYDASRQLQLGLPETFANLYLGNDERFFIVQWGWTALTRALRHRRCSDSLYSRRLGEVSYRTPQTGLLPNSNRQSGEYGDAPTANELEAILPVPRGLRRLQYAKRDGGLVGYQPSPIPT